MYLPETPLREGIHTSFHIQNTNTVHAAELKNKTMATRPFSPHQPYRDAAFGLIP